MTAIYLDTGNWPAPSPYAAFSLQRVLLNFYSAIAPEVTQELQAAAPIGTGMTRGRLKDSIYSVVNAEQSSATGGQTLMLEFCSDAPEAKFVLAGTSAHEITPVNALALHWFTVESGSEVFATRVNHPATNPNPFPDIVAAEAIDWLQPVLQNFLLEGLEGL